MPSGFLFSAGSLLRASDTEDLNAGFCGGDRDRVRELCVRDQQIKVGQRSKQGEGVTIGGGTVRQCNDPVGSSNHGLLDVRKIKIRRAETALRRYAFHAQECRVKVHARKRIENGLSNGAAKLRMQGAAEQDDVDMLILQKNVSDLNVVGDDSQLRGVEQKPGQLACCISAVQSNDIAGPNICAGCVCDQSCLRRM